MDQKHRNGLPRQRKPTVCPPKGDFSNYISIYKFLPEKSCVFMKLTNHHPEAKVKLPLSTTWRTMSRNIIPIRKSINPSLSIWQSLERLWSKLRLRGRGCPKAATVKNPSATDMKPPTGGKANTSYHFISGVAQRHFTMKSMLDSVGTLSNRSFCDWAILPYHQWESQNGAINSNVHRPLFMLQLFKFHVPPKAGLRPTITRHEKIFFIAIPLFQFLSLHSIPTYFLASALWHLHNICFWTT